MTFITTEPDMNIEPGHQFIVLPDSEEGYAILTLLGGNHPTIKRGNEILLAHDYSVDRMIVQLIDELAHVRFSAPGLVQMTMEETAMPTHDEQVRCHARNRRLAGIGKTR